MSMTAGSSQMRQGISSLLSAESLAGMVVTGMSPPASASDLAEDHELTQSPNQARDQRSTRWAVNGAGGTSVGEISASWEEKKESCERSGTTARVLPPKSFRAAKWRTLCRVRVMFAFGSGSQE